MRKRETRSDERALLLRLMDEAYDKTAWHGPNLRGPTRRISPQQAVWRPGRGRHNIAEIVVHCAYWKYAVRRRTSGEKRGSFPLKGSNWFTLPARLKASQWRDYLALLDDQHRVLRETIAATPWARLCDADDGKSTPLAHLYGIAMHDTYHAGQIRTIKSLFKRTGTGRTGPRP